MADDVCLKKDGQLIFPSPAGEKIRIKYIWNEDRTDLVEHERIDVVKEMNERAKGMSIPEQIARLDRGDTSVLDSNRVTPEDYNCDVSGMPEHPIEVIDQVVQAKASIQVLKAKEEQDKKLKALQEDLIVKKAAYDEAMKAIDAVKAEKKDGE
jgi:hypothetical protein